MAVADVFDALTTERPYKKAWPVDEAFKTIAEGASKHFDPVIVEQLFAQQSAILAIKERWKEDGAGMAAASSRADWAQ